MTRWLAAIPIVSALLVLVLGTVAHAQLPGPADAGVIPPWAWSVAVGGLLALVALLGSALVTLAGRYTVAQLRRLDSIESSVRDLSSEVKAMHKLAEGIGVLHRRIDGIERTCLLQHADGK